MPMRILITTTILALGGWVALPCGQFTVEAICEELGVSFETVKY